MKMVEEQSNQTSQEDETKQSLEDKEDHPEQTFEKEESETEQISEQIQSKQTQKTKLVVCRYPNCDVQCHSLNSMKVPLKDNEKRKEWNKILNWKGPKKAGRVCINHFIPDDDYFFEDGKPDANGAVNKILKFHPSAKPQPQFRMRKVDGKWVRDTTTDQEGSKKNESEKEIIVKP